MVVDDMGHQDDVTATVSGSGTLQLGSRPEVIVAELDMVLEMLRRMQVDVR